MIGGGLAVGTAVAAGDNEGARFVRTVASRPTVAQRLPMIECLFRPTRFHLAPCRTHTVCSVRTPLWLWLIFKINIEAMVSTRI